MDSTWDLDSVMELCCSKLSPEAELPPFHHGGNLSWLDEKVDLSAWADLDFPDDLPPAAMFEDSPPLGQGYSSHLAPSFLKLGPWESHAHSAPLSPEFLSPPSSPNTPSAIVPNVDLFLNVGRSPVHPGSSTTTTAEEHDVGLCEVFLRCEDDLVAVRESDSLSPPLTPTVASSSFQVLSPEPVTAVDEVPSLDVFAVSPTCSSSACIDEEEDPMDKEFHLEEDFVPEKQDLMNKDFVPEEEDLTIRDFVPKEQNLINKDFVPEEEDLTIRDFVPQEQDQMDKDFVPEDEDSTDKDFVPDAAEMSDSEDPESPGPSSGKRSKGRGRQPRRRRGEPGNRRERKRLQNKDAATRYRLKKKQECDLVEGVMKELNDTNQSLKSEAQRLSNEISYLKGLMREMFKAKGLLK